MTRASRFQTGSFLGMLPASGYTYPRKKNNKLHGKLSHEGVEASRTAHF